MRHLPLLLSALATALPGPARAMARPDDDEDQDLTELSLEELYAFEIEDVVTASRQVQKTTEAPASVTVVTAEQIQRYGWRTLADVLRSVRGFDVTYDRTYFHTGVRGFNPLGDFNSRLLLLVDGHRVNDQIYNTAPTGREFALDLDLVERIEIVRGPGSSLYGSNAFFGVVQVFTRRAASFDGVELEGQAESGVNGVQGRATYGGSVGEGLELVASATLYDARGFDLFYPEFTGEPGGGFSEGTDGQSAGNLYLNLRGGELSLTVSASQHDKNIPTGSYGTIFGDPAASSEDDYAYLDLAWQRRIDEHWAAQARVAYDRYEYRGTFPFDYPPRTLNRDRTLGESLSAEGQVDYGGFADHRVTAGFELRNFFTQDQSNFDPDAVYLDDHSSATQSGVFVQDEWRVAPDLRLTLGLRHDEYSTSGGSTNPRVAAVWSVDESASLKALYGTAFRAPNAFELHYHDGYISSKDSPDLQPESIETYELVWEQHLGGGFSWTAVGYHYQIEDLIAQVLDPGDGLLVYRNTDRAEASGLELELEQRWKDGWRLRLSHAEQRAEDAATGQPLVNSPEQLSKLHLLAPLSGPDLTLGVELLYTGSRPTLSGGHSGSYLLTNLTVFRRELWPGVDVSATLRNALDETYADPGGPELAQDAIVQDGRTFLLQVRARF